MDTKIIQSSLDYLLTPEGKDFLMNSINKSIRKQLRIALINIEQIKQKETLKIKENKIKEDTYLLEKPNMTDKDKKIMEEIIKYLKKNNMKTASNIRKLETIIYGENYIEIWWIKFSRQKLISWEKPQNTYNPVEIKNGAFRHHNYCFFTAKAYKEEIIAQWKTPIEYHHIKQALKTLPWKYKENDRYAWWNILLDLLFQDGRPARWIKEWKQVGLWAKIRSLCILPLSDTKIYRYDHFNYNIDEWRLIEWDREEASPWLYIIDK
jgi:hypothetical protein